MRPEYNVSHPPPPPPRGGGSHQLRVAINVRKSRRVNANVGILRNIKKGLAPKMTKLSKTSGCHYYHQGQVLTTTAIHTNIHTPLLHCSTIHNNSHPHKHPHTTTSTIQNNNHPHKHPHTVHKQKNDHACATVRCLCVVSRTVCLCVCGRKVSSLEKKQL